MCVLLCMYVAVMLYVVTVEPLLCMCTVRMLMHIILLYFNAFCVHI